jgi:predicted nucleotide-binding protein (sugar kinase/HSP70/actin superfamily)
MSDESAAASKHKRLLLVATLSFGCGITTLRYTYQAIEEAANTI